MIQFKYCYLISALIFLSKTIFGQICQTGALRVSPDKSGERLNGSVYVTFHNYGPNSCFDECIRRPRCHSFNYNMDSFHCEINEKPSPEVFVSESGYEYVYISPYRKVRRFAWPTRGAQGREMGLHFVGKFVLLKKESLRHNWNRSLDRAVSGTPFVENKCFVNFKKEAFKSFLSRPPLSAVLLTFLDPPLLCVRN